MGEAKTPSSFINSCEDFKMLDALYSDAFPQANGEGNPDGEEETSATKLPEIKKIMLDIVEEYSDEEGKMLFSQLRPRVQERYPDFDFRKYGSYEIFTDFIKGYVNELELFSIHPEDDTKFPTVYVRKRKGI